MALNDVDDLLGEDPALGKEPADDAFAGRPGGRPLHFATPELLQAKIDEYFKSLEPVQKKNAWGEPEWCWPQVRDEDTGEVLMKTVQDADGKDTKVPVVEKRPVMTDYKVPTVAGLSMFLGFADYSSLYRYNHRGEGFYRTVRAAIQRIADFAMEELHRGNTRGAIFWLKNHGWADKVEAELYGKDGGAIKTEDVSAKERGILMHFVQQYGERAK